MSERPDFIGRAVTRPKGFSYDQFEIGKRIEHHWGRTLNLSESVLFSTLTLSANPTYFNLEYAKKLGEDQIPINPYFVYLVVFGLSVEDLTEGGRVGALVAVEKLRFLRSCYSGDTVTSVSTVQDKRVSATKPDMGLVTWHTQGFNQRGDVVVEYIRTNMMNVRN
ncbi:MaoC family dehydratase [Bradyrhizobium commune]|uniref:MaoC family dehydratase n=1 Tax=Bradyrhizobium commune TaxID=83627 RepID=A0A7S9GZB5_9BRAD|nr:MaoC family dehydratase [Bradyrhizobium commune]QPF90721.1 MaoC family dehydratase [Bradyrhizobium commune]